MTKVIPPYSMNCDGDILRIFIIRHGQTNENVQKILQGHKDTLLNDTGFEQADKLGQYLKDQNISFERVFCSDLKRCQQTINRVLSHFSEQSRPEIELTKELRERFMGEIEGMYLSDAELFAKKHEKASFREFGEKMEDFDVRVSGKLSQIATSSQNLKNVALISHGGTIRQILKHLNLEGSQYQRLIVFNTSVTVVDYHKSTNQFDVKRVGVTNHLGSGEFIVSDTQLR
ncbi:HBL343Cp [Eremothecium sinecaudum]|uniref:HBL343Cp n=1 Tax=Eremothecium sinecaudum TaxID=45286 RepID=A0A120K0P8_9SACH|nr:HBL343Cp [Eremothecium sinecaudum]AMD18559.1 HBL343Cp [Eremothecium sinecaudum]